MSALDDLYLRDLTQETYLALVSIFMLAKQDLEKIGASWDEKHGQVVVGGSTFTMSRGKLRMMGYCPVCGMEVVSTPIRRLADIADQKREFHAERHTCMDV